MMTEEEFYNKILDAKNFDGAIWEFLGMTIEEYRHKIHCKFCDKYKKKRKHCEPYNPYCCTIINYENWS